MPEDQVFTKPIDPARGEMERERTRLAREIGLASGLFYVPEVKEGPADRLATERIAGLARLSEMLDARDSAMPALLRRVGRAIATVHELASPPDPGETIGALMASEERRPVFLHGDLTTDNVCYQASEDRIVILDWSAAPALGDRSAYGDAMFDVVWFLAHAVRVPSARSLRLPDVDGFDEFVSGYEQVRPGVVTGESFAEMRARLVGLYRDELARGARVRRGASRTGYRLVQRARLRAWLRYTPPAHTHGLGRSIQRP